MPTVNVRGLDLYYADDDFTDPWSSRERGTVFMQHYFGGTHAEWRGCVPALAREYRVIRMDRRGHGQSAKPGFGYEYNVEDLLADFVGVLDALGIDRVHYVGQMLGGVLGALFAIAHPERVRSLIIVTSPCYIRDRIIRNFARPGFADGPSSVMGLGEWAYAHSARRRPGEGDQDVPDPATEDMLRAAFLAEQSATMPAHLRASLMRMVSAPDFNISGVLPSITVPTLLISPTAPSATDDEEQEFMRKSIPNCEQLVFEGVANSWSAPDRLAQACLDFIRKH